MKTRTCILWFFLLLCSGMPAQFFEQEEDSYQEIESTAYFEQPENSVEFENNSGIPGNPGAGAPIDAPILLLLAASLVVACVHLRSKSRMAPQHPRQRFKTSSKNKAIKCNLAHNSNWIHSTQSCIHVFYQKFCPKSIERITVDFIDFLCDCHWNWHVVHLPQIRSFWDQYFRLCWCF